MKQKLIVTFKLAVALGLLAYLLGSGKLQLSKLADLESWGWLAVAQLLVFSLLSTSFLRWHLLLRAQGIDYDARETYALGFIGFFFNQFVPGSTGGDLVKAYYVAVEHPQHRVAGITVVFLDRAMGLLVLVAICSVASFVAAGWIRRDAELEWFAYGIVSLLGGSVLAMALFFSERVRSHRAVRGLFARLPFSHLLDRVQASVYLYKRHPGLVATAVAMSAVVHLLLVLSALCYARAVGALDLPISAFFFLVPLAHLAMALPLSPGGLGVGEFAYIELFRRAGSANGDVIAILHRLSFYLWALVGLAMYLLRRKKVKRAIALGESAQEADAGQSPEAENRPHDPARVVGEGSSSG